jgi:hypothetical protein
MEHFELNEKNFPLRRMIVIVDGEEIEWIISTESLNQEIELYGHRSFASEIIDDTVIFYVPDDILFSDCVADFVKANLDVDFSFVKWDDSDCVEVEDAVKD